MKKKVTLILAEKCRGRLFSLREVVRSETTKAAVRIDSYQFKTAGRSGVAAAAAG
jgi:hypothetical protein